MRKTLAAGALLLMTAGAAFAQGTSQWNGQSLTGRAGNDTAGCCDPGTDAPAAEQPGGAKPQRVREYHGADEHLAEPECGADP